MEKKYFLLLAVNTTQMLALNKLLIQNAIVTDLVPAPPESGTVCAIAVKVSEDDIEKSKDLTEKQGIFASVMEDRKFKLAGLIKEKTAQSVSHEFLAILQKIEVGDDLNKEEIVYILTTKSKKEEELIFHAADRIRKDMVGDHVEIRGAIEFSNICRKSCKYCGINGSIESLDRYRMSEQEILEEVELMNNIGIRTVILQSGEDLFWTSQKLINIIGEIKQRYKMRVTLSIGEREKEEYEQLKNAGADNFLLKIETTNPKLFKSIHPDDDFEYRLQCSRWLKELGYINGSGNMIGLPGQTVEDIASDILYFKEMGINMIGIGPFIPAKGSEFENEKPGEIGMTLRAVAATRIVCKKVYIPSTTALATLDKDAQVMALKAGANTIMLINTPRKYRENYQLYDNKNMVDMNAAIYAVEKAGRKMPSYIKMGT